VTLDLVHSRNKLSLLNQSLQVLVGEVRDTNGADLALRELVDRLPCFAVRNRVVNVDLVSVCGSREEVRVRVFSRAEVDRPVNEIEIKVVKLELSKGVVKSSFNVLRVVLGVPKLGSDEYVLAFEVRDVLESTLDALSNLFLVLIADWCKNY
jgi:hypothetical protein